MTVGAVPTTTGSARPRESASHPGRQPIGPCEEVHRLVRAHTVPGEEHLRVGESRERTGDDRAQVVGAVLHRLGPVLRRQHRLLGAAHVARQRERQHVGAFLRVSLGQERCRVLPLADGPKGEHTQDDHGGAQANGQPRGQLRANPRGEAARSRLSGTVPAPGSSARPRREGESTWPTPDRRRWIGSWS